MPPKKKKRLDQAVVDLHLAPNLPKAQAHILAGEIWVNGKNVTKAGQQVNDESRIELRSKSPKYVSRGGIKLEGALKRFQMNVEGLRCLDVGASTGGFTDCLLQHGADHVFTIDVGKGQLDPKIRNHPKVTAHESFHVRELKPDQLARPVDLAVVDVAFISLRKVLPFVIPCIRSGGHVLALIKPQFEVTAKDLAKGGVLKDETKRQEVLQNYAFFAADDLKLKEIEIADAVIRGPEGNQESFLFARKALE